MTGATVKPTDTSPAGDAPPPGTAIVRPLRHVRAVREHWLLRFADPAEAAASRSARAWAWALGETTAAPVTDRQTAAPPTQSDIKAEIAEADDRRLRGDRENRADAAATILRWLIGHDDHVPVQAENPGELVGGFGDIVRSRDQIGSIRVAAMQSERKAAARSRGASVDPGRRLFAQQEADYLSGVAATLSWILGERDMAPIGSTRTREPGARDLKVERLHAQDVIEQASIPWMTGQMPSLRYGEGVKLTISWLLGDSIASPIEADLLRSRQA